MTNTCDKIRFNGLIERQSNHGPTDKQHFLNTIYERFFQGYSVKLADTMGIVYTPQPIVDFMCASVEELLQKQFGKTLGSPGVDILDPCTGTGNFIVNLMKRIRKKDLPRVYRQQLFANEIMLLPYYIAAMNVEHAYYELTGSYEPFEGLCFVDTLDMTESNAPQFSFMNAKNTERVERQKQAPITVILGNPPYNANQVDENDNNRNRGYEGVDGRIRMTYARDSKATLKNKLYDPYVKFFRWASDRLGTRDGIVCYVSNNSFAVDPPPFDGMRHHLLKDFDSIFHVDLHGNVRHNPKLSGTTHNVFGIQVGVGVTIAIRARATSAKQILYHRVPERMRREEKLNWLSRVRTVGGVEWTVLTPDNESNWIDVANADVFQRFAPMGGTTSGIFERFSTGAKSNRDDVVYDFRKDVLLSRVREFCEAYNAEVDRWKRSGAGRDIDSFVGTEKVQWSSTLKLHLKRGRSAEFSEAAIRMCLYRPFTKRYLYFDDVLNDRPGIFRSVFPTVAAERENRAIYCTSHTQVPFVVQIVDCIANEAVGGRAGHCFPFYLYDAESNAPRENISDAAAERVRSFYKDSTIGKWHIFEYLYGLLHHPGYRTAFAANLKRELPRIPLAPDFWAFSNAGKSLSLLHLEYEKLLPWDLKWIETRGIPLSYRVQKMKLQKDKAALIINESLRLEGIPREVFEYRLGNRSALEWIVDQYQVYENIHTGIFSDPNREDDPEYIVRLVGQVVRASVETQKIVGSLPLNFETSGHVNQVAE